MKPCRKCGGTERYADGHCKPCTRIRAIKDGAKYRAANFNKESARHAKRYVANAGKIKEQAASYKLANPELRRIHQHNRNAKIRSNGGRLSNGIAEKLFSLQRGMCACGCKQSLGDDYQLDHRMPIALGGSNTDDNMQLLTKICNGQKHAKHPVDFMQSRGFLL